MSKRQAPVDPLVERARGVAVGLLVVGLASLFGCGLLVLGIAVVRPQTTAFGLAPLGEREQVLDLPLPTSAPLSSPTPTAPATPSPSSIHSPIQPATPTPSQYYITCRDGRMIVGTSTEGACAGQGGVLSVSVTPPQSPPLTPAEPSVTFLTVRGAAPGGQASVTVQTQPGRSCSVVYTSPAGEEMNVAGLNNQLADRTGRASWQWTVPASTPPGVGKVTVTCGDAKASAAFTVG